MEQRDPELPLERCDSAGYGWRRRSEGASRGRETALIGHGDKGGQGLEPIHYSPF
jgi:hypothetical protein